MRAGGVVAIPTETVYGLAANAFDPIAVARIFEIKARPSFDPLIVHVAERMLDRVAAAVPPAARALIDRFWPGPLTLVLAKRPEVPDLVTAGLATVAVRMPAHPVARAVIERAGVPLAAPSANPFGYISPTRAERVNEMLGDLVDLILDAGPTEHGVESTIVRLEPRPQLLRPGAIPVEAIEAVVGPLLRDAADIGAPQSPGRLPAHYAPRTALRVIELDAVPLAQRGKAGALGFTHVPEGYACARVLSELGDLREAAAGLFEALHELDAAGVERIDAAPVTESGLGSAIMDRLRRAAAATFPGFGR